jgi:predicted RNA-binding protein with PUA-like domain
MQRDAGYTGGRTIRPEQGATVEHGPSCSLPRLSVQPVSDAEWRIICQMGRIGASR